MVNSSWFDLVVPALLAVQESSSSSGGSDGTNEAAGIAALLALGGIFCCGAIGIGIAIQAVIAWLISGAQKRVPQPMQLMSPGMVWLLLIPGFHLVWNFFVFARVPRSLQAAAAARNLSGTADCGERWGLFYSIAAAVTVVSTAIPILNLFVPPICGLAAIVFLILSIVGMRSASGQLQ